MEVHSFSRRDPLSFQQMGVLDVILSSALNWTTHAPPQTHTHTHTSLISTSKRPPLLLNLEWRSVIVLPPAVKKAATTLKKFKTTSSYSGPKTSDSKRWMNPEKFGEVVKGVGAQCSFSPKAKHWLGRMSETPKLSEAPSPSKPDTRSLVLTTGPQRPDEILLVILRPIFNFTQHLHFGNMKGIMTSDKKKKK